MKNIKIILVTWLLFFIVFIVFGFYASKNQKNTKAIFDIVSNESIDLDNTKLKNYNYKKIENTLYLWKWFFINDSWFFITSKHILKDKNKMYFIKIDGKKYNFEVKKNYHNKDLIVWVIKNYKSNFFLKQSKNSNLSLWDNVFTLKDNKILYWRVLYKNKKIESLELDKLIEIDIKLKKWDSWSPLFNLNWELIWIASAINEMSWNSFFQELNSKNTY